MRPASATRTGRYVAASARCGCRAVASLHAVSLRQARAAGRESSPENSVYCRRCWRHRGCVVTGTGRGAFTFVPEGLSYLDDPAPQELPCRASSTRQWTHGPTMPWPLSRAAICARVRAVLAKATGYRHSGVHLHGSRSIMITPRLPERCRTIASAAHGDFVHDIVPGPAGARRSVKCVHCHRNSHGRGHNEVA